jgi:CheY-like chemotaxis protein
MSAEKLSDRRGAPGAQPSPRLLLVDQDAWCRAIADGALRAQGYRVVCTGDAETSVRVARELLPDLVVFDVSLPLFEEVPPSQRRSSDRPRPEPFPRVSPAYAILRALELEPAGVHPVVLLKDEAAGDRSRTSRFAVLGYVSKPFTPYTLVRQLESHVGRLRFRAEAASAPAPPPEKQPASEAALEGSVDLFGVPAILEVLHFNKLSGVCSFRGSAGSSAEVQFRQGEIVGARAENGLEGANAIFRMISWTEGRFSFVHQTPSEDARLPLRFEQLLLEGMKRLDEQRLFPFPMMMGTAPRVGRS